MSIYSIGQMNQLGDALEAAGFTPNDVTRLQQFKKLSMLRAVLSGSADIVFTKQVIDCDADPFVPNFYCVHDHIKGGFFEWDLSQIELYFDKGQQEGKSIRGSDLRRKLAGKKVLNACVLDFLLAHPDLIPEEWKGKLVFFWGTIYRRFDNNLCVRCLYWNGDRWCWTSLWLDRDFGGCDPAVLSK